MLTLRGGIGQQEGTLEMADIRYLVWQAADSRKPVGSAIQDARAAFAAKYGGPATVVRVPVGSVLPGDLDLPVEAVRTVHAGQVWVGAEWPVGSSGQRTEE